MSRPERYRYKLHRSLVVVLVIVAGALGSCQREKVRLEIEPRADEVRQIGTDLVWKRCVVGRTWDGK